MQQAVQTKVPTVMPMGHNNPPSDIEIVRSRLSEKERGLRLGLEQVNSTPIPESVSDEAQAGALTERLKSLRNIKKAVDEAHKDIKAPYLECGRVVDAWRSNMLLEVDGHMANAAKPLNDFLARKEAEERQRQLEAAEQELIRASLLAESAAKHEAAGIADTAGELMGAALESEATAQRVAVNINNARPADLARSRSSNGSTASRKMQWVGQITNLSGVDLEKLRPYFSQEAVQKALDAFVRNGGRECGGTNISEEVVGLNLR